MVAATYESSRAHDCRRTAPAPVPSGQVSWAGERKKRKWPLNCGTSTGSGEVKKGTEELL